MNPVAKVAERELEHWGSDTQPERMTTESKLADKFVVFLIDEWHWVEIVSFVDPVEAKALLFDT